MLRLVNLGLGAVALWLAILLVVGELNGWAHVLPLLALMTWGFAAGRALRRRSSLRIRPDGAEYEQEVSNDRER